MNIQSHFAAITPQAQTEPDSGIVKAAMYGFGRPGVIPLWAGEGNLPTPEAFCKPAADSLLKGETFYTWQRGAPELRQAIADYMSGVYATPFAGEGAFTPERFFVTIGGMHALQIALRMACGNGDEAIVPTPRLNRAS